MPPHTLEFGRSLVPQAHSVAAVEELVALAEEQGHIRDTDAECD